MTQEEKKLLLLKDLCARLPHGVKVKIKEEGVLSYDSGIGVIVGKEHVDNEIFIIQCKNDSWCLTAISEFVPYLRPLSSMTENEKQEIRNFFRKCIDDLHGKSSEEQFFLGFCQDAESLDYLNMHHLDYRGLIPMGLALEAKEGMYNF